MKLGAFSISLAVKDIHASKEFYKKLGFEDFGGDINQNWLIMKNGNCLIGLFQVMFEKNILTFNPGWNENAENGTPSQMFGKFKNNLKKKELNFQGRQMNPLPALNT